MSAEDRARRIIAGTATNLEIDLDYTCDEAGAGDIIGYCDSCGYPHTCGDGDQCRGCGTWSRY